MIFLHQPSPRVNRLSFHLQLLLSPIFLSKQDLVPDLGQHILPNHSGHTIRGLIDNISYLISNHKWLFDLHSLDRLYFFDELGDVGISSTIQSFSLLFLIFFLLYSNYLVIHPLHLLLQPAQLREHTLIWPQMPHSDFQQLLDTL